MTRLSIVSGLSPKCLYIKHVGIGDLAIVRDAHPKDTDVYKGKIGTRDVIVKVLKKQLGPNEERLKMLMKQAIDWQKLHHDNVLPVLGLYYYDEARLRPCLVYPWMEQRSLDESDPRGDLNVFATGAIAGIRAIDKQKLVHGDLQNRSFLIDKSNVAHIADLGLASLLHFGTLSQTDSTSDRRRCARALCKLYGTQSANVTRPKAASEDIWDTIQRWSGINTQQNMPARGGARDAAPLPPSTSK
ncbi:hypothetical protein AAF712_015042 [Marasmius tenuissimus]|uniref:Protein kinase domain-containing protein n=1 Tax=Marasmius tenuissimus TaxID=585030 RepID=A0ABR2ZBK8_9AGAR